jgi:spore cortex formation protein SpoVR/YcgB (stage V sporulation)
MNEGWATYWHYTLLNTLYDEGLLTDSFMMEFLHSHTNVVYQPGYDEPWYRGINPYALGLPCGRTSAASAKPPPTKTASGSPTSPAATGARPSTSRCATSRTSFVAQFLSPKVMRDFRLFAILDDDKDARLKVSAIHDEAGYRRVREILSDNYNLGSREPNLQVWERGPARRPLLTLRHQAYLRRPLSGDCEEVLKHVAHLWGFAVRLEVARRTAA